MSGTRPGARIFQVKHIVDDFCAEPNRKGTTFILEYVQLLLTLSFLLITIQVAKSISDESIGNVFPQYISIISFGKRYICRKSTL